MYRLVSRDTFPSFVIMASFLMGGISRQAHAGTPISKKPKSRIAAKSTTPYTADEFQPSTTQLPPDYWGNDIEKAYKDGSPAPKGEFETSDAFQGRVAKSKQPRTYAFRVESIDAKYDADRKPTPGFDVNLPLEERRRAPLATFGRRRAIRFFCR